ncbi:MAG: PD40 domain-containing protein [Deltaproteobacteria bacterium]|nr:PD40 domain-containing protein [Deltaproteobacteria bacterium]
MRPFGRLSATRPALTVGAVALVTAACLGSACVDSAAFVDASPAGDLRLGDGGLTGLSGLKISPENALHYAESTALKLNYRAIGSFVDGSERDVSAYVSFTSSDPHLGVFLGSEFNVAQGLGGQTTISVTSGAIEASTKLTIIYRRTFSTRGKPDDVRKAFDAAKEDASSPLELAYPPDGVLVPPNLTDLEFQWKPGAGQGVFEIGIRNAGTDIRMYTDCSRAINGIGCGYVPTAEQWAAIVSALRGSDGAEVMVRGAPADLSRVGASKPRQLLVADDDIKGALYYWNATPGSVVRYDFGRSGQPAKQFVTTKDAGGLFCVGCHALSRNGKRLAVGLDIPAPSALKVIDVETKQVLAGDAANFMAFSPDGKKLLTSNGNSTVLRDADTLKALTPDPLIAKGTMPDWSADGALVVYAEAGETIPFGLATPGIEKGSLMLIRYDAVTDKWSAPTSLIKSVNGENNYYPSLSPDGEWVVFNRSLSSSYDADDADLWLVRSDGKGGALRLDQANQGSKLCNSWPKFGPFIQHFRGKKLLWFAFSSRRDYGLRLRAPTGERGQAQLWMVALDFSEKEFSASKADPSFAAFWLPFQDINTGNHIAQWTAEVVRKPCGVDGECPSGQTCQKSLCEPL